MSTLEFEFYFENNPRLPRVIARGGLLSSALIEEIAEERGIDDPFDLIGREEEIIRDYITTAILEPYYAVHSYLAPIERFEFEFSDADDVGMVTVTATAVFSSGLTRNIIVRDFSPRPAFSKFFELFWLRRPNYDSRIKTNYCGVGGDGRVILHSYVTRDGKLLPYKFARLALPGWRIQEHAGVITAGLMVTGKFFVKPKFFGGLYALTMLIGDTELVNVEAPVDFLSDGVKRDIEQIEKILSE